MRKRLDLTDRQVGQLTVRSFAHSRAGHVYWTCSCACGAICTHSRSHLVAGTVKSCGCGREGYISKNKLMGIRGRKYGLLTAHTYWPRAKQSRDLGQIMGRAYWMCSCDCGQLVQVTTTSLRRLRTISCDKPECRERAHQCLFDQWTDEHINQTYRRDITYSSYRAMLGRKGPTYLNVQVCTRWQEPQGFENFVKDMRLRPHRGLSLERIDPTGDYEPGNCKWDTSKAQALNKTNSKVYMVDGVKMNHITLAEHLGWDSKKLIRQVAKLVEQDMTEDQAATHLFQPHTMRSDKEDTMAA